MKKTYIIIAILALAIIFLIIIFVLKFNGQKKPSTGAQQTSATKPQTGTSKNDPIILAQSEDKKVQIKYFPQTGILNVYIEAQTVEEYHQRIEEAVKLMKDSGIETCSKNIYWSTPTNLKKEVNGEGKLIYDLTCPQGTPKPSPKP